MGPEAVRDGGREGAGRVDGATVDGDHDKVVCPENQNVLGGRKKRSEKEGLVYLSVSRMTLLMLFHNTATQTSTAVFCGFEVGNISRCKLPNTMTSS